MSVSPLAAWAQANGIKPNVVGAGFVSEVYERVPFSPSAMRAPTQSVGHRNPPPDPRSLVRSPLADGAGLHRGHMVSTSTAAVRHRLDFLWNPHTITFNYNIDTNITTGAESTYMGAGVSCSFDLVFDRQFEMMRDPKNNRGVLEDVNALEALVSLTKNNTAGQIPVTVFFGGPKSIGFTGKFAALDIQITHFTPDMRPTRALASIVLMRERPPEGPTGSNLLTGGGSSSGSSSGSSKTTRTPKKKRATKPAARLPKLKSSGAGTYNFLAANGYTAPKVSRPRSRGGSISSLRLL